MAISKECGVNDSFFMAPPLAIVSLTESWRQCFFFFKCLTTLLLRHSTIAPMTCHMSVAGVLDRNQFVTWKS